MSSFPFLCAFVKKGAAITGRGRNTPKGSMISTCFPPFSKQISITCCHLQFKEFLKNHISKWRKGEQVRLLFWVFLNTISMLWYITQTRSTKANHYLNFRVVLVLYLALLHVSLCNTLPSQERVQLVYQAGIESEQLRHGSGTGAQRTFLWLSRSPLVFLISRVLKLKGWSINGSKGYVSTQDQDGSFCNVQPRERKKHHSDRR